MPNDLKTHQPPASEGSFIYLLGVCLVAALGGLLYGFDTAVINGGIEQIQEQFGLTAAMKGVVAGSALVGCLFGAAVAGAIADRFGRKKAMFLAAALFAISAVAAAMPHTAGGLIAARFAAGLGIGIASVLSPLYIAEIAPARLRGALVAGYQLALCIGILGAFVSNYSLWSLSQYWAQDPPALMQWAGGLGQWMFVDQVWRAMFLAGLVPAMVLFVVMFLPPESPRWLIQQGRTEEARRILARVSGPAAAAESLVEIRDAIAAESGSLRQLLAPGLRLALLIGIVLPFLVEFSGIDMIIYYGDTVFQAAGFEKNYSLLNQLVFGLVNMVFTVPAIFVVDRFGRRPMLLIGAVGVGTTLLVAGALFGCDPIPGVWLVLTFAAFLACFSFCYGPVWGIIVAEIFPTRVRGRAMSVANFSIWTATCMMTFGFPPVMEALGPRYTLWALAFSAPVMFFFVWRLVPETKGKTLEEIERVFSPGDRHP